MKIAIVGSRSIGTIDVKSVLPNKCTEIISGGARGVDTCVAEFAEKSGIKLTVFLPQYEKYGRAAPILRNKMIVDYADKVIVFWDGASKGSKSIIEYSKKIGKECAVIINNKQNYEQCLNYYLIYAIMCLWIVIFMHFCE